MKEVLVLYYSHGGAVGEMATFIARGIESIPGVKARIRTVPKVTSTIQALEDSIPSEGPPHGGNESTLLSMQLPLLHLGMVIMGVPYSVPELSSTKTGGTPYGPSHVAGESNKAPISEDEKKICLAMGKRLAETALKLSA